MAYNLPNKVADFEEGGDGYDLEKIFTEVNRGTTCTYDDLIFLPGKWCLQSAMMLYMIDFRNES